MALKGNMLIAQGGGPTAVINQSLAGAVMEASSHGEIERVYGALNGVRGIIEKRVVDLTDEKKENLEEVAQTPSAALLSTRDKPDSDYCRKIFSVLKEYNIRYFFYIGGNDSSDTLRIVSEFASEENYDMRTVHIPKTVDNDLVLNDHTPGYPSAARFVADAFVGLDLDNRSLPGVYIAVVMGRHAGFLTAASALARKDSGDGPHLVYLPERAFDMDNYVRDVKDIYSKYGRCVVAVSEGIQDANGTPVAVRLAEEVEKDAHGNVQLSGSGSLGDSLKDYVKDKTDISRVRADTFGYIQRSYRGAVSDVDAAEAREAGKRAVQYAVEKDLNGSVTINRTGDYEVQYGLFPLQDIAGKTRHMPDEFINAEGNNVTDEFIKYLRPLLGSDFKSGGAKLRALKEK